MIAGVVLAAVLLRTRDLARIDATQPVMVGASGLPVTEVWQRPALRCRAQPPSRPGGGGAAFAEEGLDVGMAEIARRAGVGNATVFRRFPTKDALYEAIVDEKIAELVTGPGPSRRSCRPWARSCATSRRCAELQARDRGFFQATEQHLFEHPELLRRHRAILDVIEPLVVPRSGGGRRARRRDHGRRGSGWSRARSPACRPPRLCAPTAGAGRWPSSSTRCARRRPRRCPSRRSPTRRSSGRWASSRRCATGSASA